MLDEERRDVEAITGSTTIHQHLPAPQHTQNSCLQKGLDENVMGPLGYPELQQAEWNKHLNRADQS